MKLPCLTLLCAVLAGCAGFSAGWESLPYIGDAPPARVSETFYQSQQHRTLSLDGLSLYVSLENRLRTRDTQVILFAVPVALDWRETPLRQGDRDLTRVYLTVMPQQHAYDFAWQACRLQLGSQQLAPLRAEALASGTSLPLADKIAVPAGQRRAVVLYFPVSPPDPRRSDLALDLRPALQAPGQPALPLIRFAAARWAHGYT